MEIPTPRGERHTVERVTVSIGRVQASLFPRFMSLVAWATAKQICSIVCFCQN